VLSSASNDYTGGTVLSRGIMNITGTLAADSDLGIGPATFSYQNNANLSLGTLRFTGGFSILENLNSGTSSLTFSGLAVSNGAIARVSDAAGYDPVKFSADVSANDLTPGLWWGDGRNLAALDSSTGNLRAMNYATDNGFVFAGGTEIGADNSGKNVSLNRACPNGESVAKTRLRGARK
jgi:autotransporter-associated beta strand protein